MLFKDFFLEAVSDEPDMEYAMVDQAQKADFEPGHRPLEGRHDDQNTGTDRFARLPYAFHPAATAEARSYRRPATHRGIDFDGLIADKAFDSNSIIAELNEPGAKKNRHLSASRSTKPIAIKTEIYNRRHLIENFFATFKGFNRIAMRADKTDRSFKP